MKNNIQQLQPEQIIVPSEYGLGNESILKIYFRLFDRGHGADLPPIIVTSSKFDQNLLPPAKNYERSIRVLEEWERKGMYVNPGARNFSKKCFERAMAKYSGILEKIAQFNKDGARYFLLDGNHRSAAATLTHQPISALELQTDEDLEEVRKMVGRGELFDFKRECASLVELIGSFYEFCKDRLEDFSTVRERIDELTSNGDLPKYMTERYLR